jgi:Kef-type K+ transport system membrane component KefB/nucleotide-binding universal stress UspA family protein
MAARLASTGSKGQMHAEDKVSLGGGICATTLPGLLAAVPLCLLAVSVFAADNPSHGPSEVIFLLQIIALLVCGRLLGELMQRVGQPPVMGQLIAGILLGPSALGALWPGLQHALFPTSPEQKAMIDAVAQLGILLLLLLTGMETDLAVVRRSRGAAFSVSITGIFVPFLCGVLLGELLPDAMLPNPEKRLITTLFLGTALSISSVKIVAMVVREVGFLRRTVGQVIVAAAIIDDTIGWIIVSVIFGLALHGGVDLPALAQSLLGTAIFLVLSFTIGRRLVFRVIRWANDSFVSEVPVITAILVVTGLMALATNAIGVHTVLGAFVAGILVGQSPILTRHIDEQLRGLIVALFMPVFFGLAGLNTNLAVLANTDLLLLTFGLIVIASLGKFSGAFLGGRLGGMSWAQSLALGCGMNARGSTEVIIATIGLSMGVLNQDLFTTIVAMAVVTTMSMPPMLRWALARLPMNPEEAARLEREEFEAKGFVSNIERLLVAVDASPSGQFTSRLVGLLAGARRIAATVIHFDYATGSPLREGTRQAEHTKAVVEQSAAEGDDAGFEETAGDPAEIATRVEKPSEQVIGAEAKKGYGLLFIGREPASEGDTFHEQITRSAIEFAGPFAIVIARGIDRRETLGASLKILVPVTGTTASRHGAELAIALAQASQGSVTALHVARGERRARSWQRHVGAALAPASSADAVIREIVRLGDHYGVEVKGAVRSVRTPQEAILRQLEVGGHNLLVMGVSPRPGDQLFFGQVPAELLERAKCSVLFVASEPAIAGAEPDKTSAIEEYPTAPLGLPLPPGVTA